MIFIQWNERQLQSSQEYTEHGQYNRVYHHELPSTVKLDYGASIIENSISLPAGAYRVECKMQFTQFYASPFYYTIPALYTQTPASFEPCLAHSIPIKNPQFTQDEKNYTFLFTFTFEIPKDGYRFGIGTNLYTSSNIYRSGIEVGSYIKIEKGIATPPLPEHETGRGCEFQKRLTATEDGEYLITWFTQPLSSRYNKERYLTIVVNEEEYYDTKTIPYTASQLTTSIPLKAGDKISVYTNDAFTGYTLRDFRFTPLTSYGSSSGSNWRIQINKRSRTRTRTRTRTKRR